MKKLFSRYERQINRLLEILPGFISWNLILFPFWGSFVFPEAVAYYVLVFDIYWVYQSAFLGITSLMAHYQIEAAKVMDWLGEVKLFPDWKKVHHVIIVVTYKEPLHILQRTLRAIANQDFPLEQITVVLAMEKKEDEKERAAKVKALKKEFGKKFGHLLVTVHELKPGEVAGKGSNENYAGREAKRYLVDELGYKIDYLTVTSCDADHCYHPKHFSCLAYKFLDDPQRYLKFWQPAIMFYNNFWRLPAATRVTNTFGTVWNMALIVRTDRLINCQNYSASLKLIDEVGYWDPHVIPEDYRIFFKAFFAKEGRVEVDPIPLPLWVDAAESESFGKTLKNQYEQYKRWAWGTSDDPYIIKQFLTQKTVSFSTKIFRVFQVIKDHFLWPVNWFVITLGFNIPILLNPEFSKTALGHTLPRLSSIILTAATLFLGVIIWVSAKQRPPRPKEVSRWRAALVPLEFILMPVVGFFFNALPGIDAHTRLMLGKYLEYRVTEKV